MPTSKRALSPVTILALCATPWIICLSTTNPLFLANQADLDYDLRNYIPFLAAFFSILACGFILFLVTRNRPFLWSLAWAYHLAGIAFLIFFSTSEIRAVPEHQEIWITVLLGGICTAIVLLRKTDPQRGFSFLAIFAVLLITSDFYRFFSKYELTASDRATASDNLSRDGMRSGMVPSITDKKITAQKTDLVSRHNIYHLVLDGYQSDLFPLTLDEDSRPELNGFVLFPRNVTTSGRTRISIPSVFVGRTWDNDNPITQFTDTAMNSPSSLLYWLKKAGYTTTAYLHKRFSFEPNLFDRIFYHHNAARHRNLGRDAFNDLWVFRFLPRFISNRVLDDETITEILHKSLSPKIYPVHSYDTFVNFMKQEKNLSATDRYTFLHLLLPHHPYVLDRDCNYREATKPIEQFCCATRVIVSLVRLLKNMDRFQASLIIIQADHGLNFTLGDNGELKTNEFVHEAVSWNLPRSKTLLLVKPAGVDASEELIESDAETTIIDITPTIYRSIHIEPPVKLEGHPLIPPPDFSGPRRRYYQYFVGNHTEEVYQFVAEGDSFRFDKIMRPSSNNSNIPTVPAGSVSESDSFTSDAR